MNILVNSRQMKQLDKNTTEHFKIPSMVLMERAAVSTADEIEGYMKKTDQRGRTKRISPILLVCGAGNNGGDGLAIGRILFQRGYEVVMVMPEEHGTISPQTRLQLEICTAYGLSVKLKIPKQEYAVVVDALFGIGLTRELSESHAALIDEMNRIDSYKVAVDIPSGIHADTGQIMKTAFCAHLTVTFAYAKLGLLWYPGADYAGRVIVTEIGIEGRSFLEEQPLVSELGKEDLSRIPKREQDSNKGSFGRVLVAAGQKNMAGAGFLSANAAYVTGAGLVKVFTQESNRIVIQQLLPEAVLETYEPDQVFERALKDAAGWASVIAAGPGIGTKRSAKAIVKTILETAEVPVVLDADALNVLSEHKEWLKAAKAKVIITPHLGEMARLLQMSISDMKKQLLQVALNFAREYNVICVLKDTRTVTALPDGRAFVNTSGNSGMATAGSGDVLTGIIAGLLAQGMQPEEAAPFGVYIHGAAADFMVKTTGTYGLLARDIIKGIPMVIR